ncbi:hypothetical protein GCM10023349_32260 [Nocardioides conyzicola]|uniref:DUF4082 domain-containing protein n=1 Tax=Nocardioides conyzicola TaxID=1651781 RepID=A0ABP8XLU1_9ACTN
MLLGLIGSVLAVVVLQQPAGADTRGLFEEEMPADAVLDPDREAVELGMRFVPKVDGLATGVRVYKISGSTLGTPDSGTLWGGRGRALARATFEETTETGWLSADFADPVELSAGQTYTISVHAPHGRYAVTEGYFDRPIDSPDLRAPGYRNGVYAYGPESRFPFQTYRQSNYWVDVSFVAGGTVPTPTDPTPTDPATTPTDPGPTDPTTTPTDPGPTSSPTDPTPTEPTPTDPGPSSTPTDPTPTDPTTTPTEPGPTEPTDPTPTEPPGAWPGAGNTGVPSGTTLTRYTGPCTISRPTTITAVDATSCGAILVRSPGVVISKSLLPRVDATDGGDDAVTLTDSTVRGGSWVDGAVWGYNITATRVEVTGGQHSFHCADHCTVTDSWLHDQYNPTGLSYHNNAFISNGGNTMLVRHNTLACTPQVNSSNGGCTADLSLFGDFEPIRDVRIEGNLFVANSTGIGYCLHAGYNPGKPYGSNPTGVQVVDNVFQRGTNGKCGVWGAVTSFLSSATGNVWSGNTWDDGTALRP